MRNQELFGLTLLESEMHEIEIVVARTLATDREHEAARQDGAAFASTDWVAACADLRRHVGNRLREARRRKRVEKHGHMCNSQDFYTGQIAALVELEKMMNAVLPKQAATGRLLDGGETKLPTQ